MKTAVHAALWAGLLVLGACRSGSKPELWIIPKDYVGWLRLDYSVPGEPPLPIENGRNLVRVPVSGRLQTSSPNTTFASPDEYAVEDFTGLHRVESLTESVHPPYHPPYGVQDAYLSVGYVGKKPVARFRCVFVGTPADFRTNSQACDKWQLGEPAPPKRLRR
jgi:hypothetical protein